MSFELLESTAEKYCKSVRDGTHDSPKKAKTGYRLITSKNIAGRMLNYDGAYRISKSDFNAVNKRSKVDRWDVLISMIGTVGEPCLIDIQPDFAIKNIGLLKSKSELQGRWLFYYLCSPDAQREIEYRTGGSTQGYISLNKLRSLPVKYPKSPRGMRNIVDVLQSIDNKISNNHALAKNLESIARAIFKSWFVDFDPVRAKAAGQQPAGLDADIAALFPDQLVDSDVGEIPEGWSAGRIADVATNIRESRKSKDIGAGDVYIGLEHFTRRCLTLWDGGKGSDVTSNKSGFRIGDILFGKLRPYFHKVAIAPSEGVCSTDVLVIRPKTGHWRSFAALALFQDAVIAHATQTSSGTRMPRAKWETLAAFSQALPDDVLAAQFERTASPLLERAKHCVDENCVLATLRDTLLPRLVSGKLRVADAEQAIADAV